MRTCERSQTRTYKCKFLLITEGHAVNYAPGWLTQECTKFTTDLPVILANVLTYRRSSNRHRWTRTHDPETPVMPRASGSPIKTKEFPSYTKDIMLAKLEKYNVIQ